MSRLYNILAKIGANAIIDTGTTNGWTWRKFADGTVEMWKTSSTTQTCATAIGSGYRSPDATTETFPFTFDSEPIVNVSGRNGQVHVAYISDVTVSSFSWYPVRFASSTSSYARPISIHVIGTVTT